MAIVRSKKSLTAEMAENIGITYRYYELVGFEPILGSQPANKDLRADYIASKAPTEEMTEAELQDFDPDAEYEKGCTVFARNPKTGAVVLYDYHIKGMFKEAFKNLKAQLGIGSPNTKVDNFIVVDGRTIPLLDTETDLIKKGSLRTNERPLRAETMQGPRVALAASEEVENWHLYIRVGIVPNAGTKASRPVTWEAVEMALAQGAQKGLGQWRSGGFGRYEAYRIEDEDSIRELDEKYIKNQAYQHRPSDVI